MRFLQLLNPFRAASVEDPSVPLTSDNLWLHGMFGAGETSAGVPISHETALRIATVWACVRVISETISSLPFNVHRKLPNGGSEVASDSPLQRALHDCPNEFQTSMVFREQLLAHVLTWGNAYAAIERSRTTRRPVGFVPMLPDRTRRGVDPDGRGVYVTRTKQGDFTLPAEDVLHVPGLGFDGINGYSVITHHRETLALGEATREYGSRFFKNDARPGIIVSHPGRLSPEAQKNLMTSIEKETKQLGKKHSAVYLEEGVKITEVGIPPEDAQFLETRKFQKQEIASIFRVPPHKVGDLDRATFSNIEHQAIEFVQDTLTPWAVRFEQEINRKCFDPLRPDERDLYVKHNFNALLRGDFRARMEGYGKAIQHGIMSPNEARALEDLNPYDGGDEYLRPLNMTTGESANA